MPLSHEQEMQAITDALGVVVIAISRQIDSSRLIADLRLFADKYEAAGIGPSAGLIGALIRGLERASRGEAWLH